MSRTKPDTQLEVRLRVLTRPAPKRHEGRLVEFGLQAKDRDVDLLEGTPRGDVREFTITARAKDVDGISRLYGPYIHGSGNNQNLYVTRRWQDGDKAIIDRLKVALNMPWHLVARAQETGKVLTADGTAPEWGLTKDWHGLGVGKEWLLKDR